MVKFSPSAALGRQTVLPDLSFWQRLCDAFMALLPGFVWILASGVISGAFAVISHGERVGRGRFWGTWFSKLKTPVGRANVIWAIMLLGVSYAWFGAFDSANVENHHMADQVRASSQPDFRIESEGTILAGDDVPGSVHVLLYARVVNLGSPAAILASSWQFLVTLPNGTGIVPIPTTIASPECDRRGEGYLVFEASDQLSAKASSPIERMGYRTGVLPFVVRGVTVKEMTDPRTKIAITTTDVAHKQYTTVLEISEFLKKNDGFVYRSNFSHPQPEPVCPTKQSQTAGHVP
jgi:hypothetical protein